MTVRYCTPEWLESSAEAYQSNPRFQEELANLTARICFRVKAEPDWGIEHDIIFCGFVTQGELDQLRFFAEEEALEEAEYILAATPQEWKKILRRESRFVTDFMLGRITLDQGSKVGILSIAPHSGSLVDALTQVPLQFPDEMSPGELEDYRSTMQDIRRKLGV
jgi:hypothetical protein